MNLGFAVYVHLFKSMIFFYKIYYLLSFFDILVEVVWIRR